jgi:hypothetical protein
VSKKTYLMFFSLMFFSVFVSAEEKKERGLGKPPDETDITTPLPYQKSILTNSFRSGITYTISSSGTYILTKSTSFVGGSGQIININSDDVILDLAGQSITNDTTANINGIEIQSGKSNITIKDGVIRGITGAGIVVGAGCKNVKIKNVTVDNCDKGGIDFQGTAGNSVSDCELINTGAINCDGSALSAGTATFGLKLNQCETVRIADSFFNKNVVNSDNETYYRASYGVYMGTTTGCHFDNSEAIGNKGVTAAGFYVCSNSLACGFSECLAAANTGTETLPDTQGHGMGFGVENSAGILFENCTALANIATTTAYGFYIATSTANEITNCKANRQKTILANSDNAGTGNAHGIYLGGGKHNLVQNCEARGNIGGSNANFFGTGIMLGAEQGIGESSTEISSCRACANDCDGGTGIGIYISSDGPAITVSENKIYSNLTFGLKDANTYSTALAFKNICFGHGSIDNYNISYDGTSFVPISKVISALSNSGGVDSEAPVFQNISLYVS